MSESADEADSKSVGSNTVWVQVPPPAPNILYHNGLSVFPDGESGLWLYDVVVICNKKYLRADGDDHYYLFNLENLSDAALVVERKDNIRVVSQGDVVEIILPKNAANGEVGIVGMNGQTLGRQKVGDGQNRARFNSANLAKGVYNATFIHKNGKRESQKFVVK